MRIAIAGIGLVILGTAIFAFTMARLVTGTALDPQTKVPGKVVAEIDTPGRYYLWDNHWTTFDGERVQHAADFPETAKILAHDASGAQLEFVQDASQNWSIGNNGKTSIGYIDIASPTTIHFDIEDIGRERIVTVSDATMKQELWSRLGGLGIGLIMGLVGVPIGLFGLLFRRRVETTTG